MTPFDLETINEASMALEDGNVAEAKALLNGLLGSVDHSQKSSNITYRVRRTLDPNRTKSYYGPRHNERHYKHLGHVKQFIRSNLNDTFEVFEGESVWRALPESQVQSLYPEKKR